MNNEIEWPSSLLSSVRTLIMALEMEGKTKEEIIEICNNGFPNVKIDWNEK